MEQHVPSSLVRPLSRTQTKKGEKRGNSDCVILHSCEFSALNERFDDISGSKPGDRLSSCETNLRQLFNIQSVQ